MKKYWQLFWHFRKISLMKMVAYQTDFWFWLVVSLLWTCFNFFFFALIIRLTDNIAGWSTWELYALVSIFNMLDATTWSLMYHNMWAYTNQIFSGSLNQLLLKPIDTQFVLMTQETSYNNIPRFLIGCFGLIWSLYQLQIMPAWWRILLFPILLLSGLMVVYCLWFIVATGAFYVERLDNIHEIVPGLRRIWQIPRQVYGGILSTILTVFVPLGLVTSIPCEVLLGRNVSGWGGYLIIAAGVLLLIARKLLSKSLSRYGSVGG